MEPVLAEELDILLGSTTVEPNEIKWFVLFLDGFTLATKIASNLDQKGVEGKPLRSL